MTNMRNVVGRKKLGASGLRPMHQSNFAEQIKFKYIQIFKYPPITDILNLEKIYLKKRYSTIFTKPSPFAL